MDSNKRLTSAVDAAREEETEEMLKKRRVGSQEGSIYSQFVDELQDLLPACWSFWSQDWSYLMKFIDACSIIDLEPKSEFVSLCRWFLSTELPEPYKNGANQALKLIFPGTSLHTQMSIGHQSLSCSLEHVLDSKHEVVIQQACCAIAFLCWYHKRNYFSDDVTNKLFILVEKNSPYLDHARHAICSIACVDNSVKEKIMIKAKYDPLFKWPFQYGDAEEVEHACMFAACIFGRKKDAATWDTIEGVLIPPIVDVMRKAQGADDIPVMVAAAYAISSAAYGATPEQIEELFDMGCLAVLCFNLWAVASPPLTSHSLDGIDHILSAGGVQGHRKYVDWIENDRYSLGWEAFRDVHDKFLYLPCFLEEARHSIQYRAYLIAFVYGGCKWIDWIIEELYCCDEYPNDD